MRIAARHRLLRFALLALLMVPLSAIVGTTSSSAGGAHGVVALGVPSLPATAGVTNATGILRPGALPVTGKQRGATPAPAVLGVALAVALCLLITTRTASGRLPLVPARSRAVRLRAPPEGSATAAATVTRTRPTEETSCSSCNDSPRPHR